MNNVYPYMRGLAYQVFVEAYAAGLIYYDAETINTAYQDLNTAWLRFVGINHNTVAHGFRNASGHTFYVCRMQVPALSPEQEVISHPTTDFAALVDRARTALKAQQGAQHEHPQNSAGTAGS